MHQPLVTITVPSFNQGRYLDDALRSIFEQNIPVEVFVLDGGSTDNSVEIIRKWEHKLAGWRSYPDKVKQLLSTKVSFKVKHRMSAG